MTAVVPVAACRNDESPRPGASSSAATTSPAPLPPWTLADLTYHPCSVLGADDTARFVLQPDPKPTTPPQQLPSCTWFSIQTGLSGSFTIRFAPQTSDLSDLDQRRVRDPLEQIITIEGRRATLAPSIRPDSRNGSCSVYVSVASGGSFYLGIAAPGVSAGVDWDICAKTIDVASTISARLR
ncbi:DUF3558 domain-containing protein [Nocardia sp. NBC_00508]|uniref:DUF3558 family protein n=1 Tax=Nocardia sp. NBC_00508 TaxID=2975992 RepID=UPI002E80E7C1|nr:DUF3558 family protein [Nocardia sp. NBC_00508]WUD66088.1 DUF3558 domain-containing protein [Nocardia sp. NBC_00508]